MAVCGNGACEAGEDASSCCSDCACASGFACVTGSCQPSCGALGGSACEAGGNGACNGLGPATYDCDHCCGGAVSATPSCGAVGGQDCETNGNNVCGGAGQTTYDCDHCCSCGGSNQACCGSASCDAGNTCINGGAVCRSCGGLQPGDVLHPGESVTSCGGVCGNTYQLTMQGDGNLVLYELPAHKALWATSWVGEVGNGAYAVMQGDGNLVVYSSGCTGGVCWNSGTNNHPNVGLTLQGDGNMVIYDGSCPGGVCWNSETSATTRTHVTTTFQDKSGYCVATGSFYTQQAVTYFNVDGDSNLYYMEDPTGGIDFDTTLYSGMSGYYNYCYLDACGGTSTCPTPFGNYPCFCTSAQAYNVATNQCQNSLTF